MTPKPINADGYKLMHEGAVALAEVEANGILVDTVYLERTIVDTDAAIKQTQQDIKDDPIYYKYWHRRYGDRTTLGATDQIGTVLIKDLGYEWKEFTPTGRPKVTEETLAKVDLPICRNFTKLTKLIKTRSTYLENIRRETNVDNLMRPTCNLHTTRTFRSSYSDPNLQNMPIRDEEMGATIRKAIIAPDGYLLVEIDYSQIEVRGAEWYNKDPNLLRYIQDPKTDMHLDAAVRLFCVPKDQPKDKKKLKGIRQAGKNQFVFPEFYGDYYCSVARGLWEYAEQNKLVDSNGTSVFELLKAKGITKLGACDPKRDPVPGTFEYHVKKEEDHLWGTMFPVYARWKKEWYEKYRKRGWFETLTGFVIEGYYARNDVTNYPIQGCLAGGSLVQTNRGLIPIKDLVGVKTKVWTGFNWAQATALDRGICQRARIKLSSGIVLECDTRHKLKNEECRWVDFKDLKVGDWVALPKNEKLIEPSDDIDWWFIFGFIIGDGCISNPKRKHLSICVGEKKLGILKNIKSFLMEQGHKENVYGGLHWKVIPPNGNKKQKYSLKIQSKRLTEFLESHGFKFGWKSHTKRVPSSVWTATIQEQRNFLEGLRLSDGSRNENGRGTLHMCNKSLLRDVQKLAAGLGFDSLLTNYGSHASLRFHWRRFNSKTSRKFPAVAIVSKVDVVKRENYDNECQYLVDKKNYRLARKGIDVSQYVAERIIEKNYQGAVKPEVYRYDKITSIQILDNVETTYTMSVDDPLHQFVADGVIHKNTAFHCLLWSLIQVVNWLKKNRMHSKVIGQIHDSMLLYIKISELQDVLYEVQKIMTQDVVKHWRWINTPLEVEVDVVPEGGSWHDKEAWVELNGLWQLKV